MVSPIILYYWGGFCSHPAILLRSGIIPRIDSSMLKYVKTIL